ncbi:MAG: haloalkane dehalogenase [Candidatus Dormibacteria bacterium]
MDEDVLRTPEERFANLADFPFTPHHVPVSGGLRMHLVDEGPRDASPVLLLHGEPSWSYLYRHMVAPLAASHRVLAPDLIGFGRSDKPRLREAHSYAAHVGWIDDLVRALDLRRITLFCQDWGGLIGLRVLAGDPDRFAAVVVANTGLPTGEGDPGDAFRAWQRASQEMPDFDCGAIVDLGTQRSLSAAEKDAYRAPFPDESHLAGPRAMPLLVPTRADMPGAAENRAAWEVLRRFDRPFVCAFSDRDPITRGLDGVFRSQVPGASGARHRTVSGAGHFLQEDQPQALVDIILDTAPR